MTISALDEIDLRVAATRCFVGTYFNYSISAMTLFSSVCWYKKHVMFRRVLN